MGVIGKITSKGQTTVPAEVRSALSVGAGDLLEWEVTGEGEATVRRVARLDTGYLRALNDTMGEWLSEEDEEAYGEL